ncbi:hypothetical protein [Spartinivicinus poritis]|uniref:Uncharacterized protein n=1 Tax=Spartinivicinus poritis TaxID=2994640 RepID=A0ABT5UGB5_9GAMM|nr:hypothetical protein [Spartinivicinus sp. A2-2]MDE1464473.1 hypothetical protein [Spartinivicinus sp. A2-2]
MVVVHVLLVYTSTGISLNAGNIRDAYNERFTSDVVSLAIAYNTP